MDFFLRYLRKKAGVIGFFLLCMGIFLLVFALYRLPPSAVAYPAALCMMLGGGFLAADYRRALRRHRSLTALARLPEELMEDLPPAAGPLEEDYQALLQALRDQLAQLRAAAQTGAADMKMYCTLWVHQIKTPIAAMHLRLQSEDTDLSRQLTEELVRVEQYVDMVLAYFRLETGSGDYVFGEYDLDGILRAAIRRFAPQFIRKKIRLDYAPIHQKVLTDEKWLCFVVEQLLSNALKYTPAGTISITLEEPMTLCVRDTGIGIAPEDLPRIFELGYTGFNGRTDKRASGIGLYLCQRICRNLGHGIAAESEPGKGTVIRLRLDRERFHGE